jgi:hypothetical protein
MRVVGWVGGVACGLAVWSSVLAQDATPLVPTVLAEPEFPAATRTELVTALRQGSVFTLPHLDERVALDPSKSLVWSGSSVSGETSVAVFSLTLVPLQDAPSQETALPPPTEIEVLVEEDAVRLRAAKPVSREYLGGLRFARASSSVRRIALRLEEGRELAVFAPAMNEGDEGFGLVFCLTQIKSEEILTKSKEKKVVESPLAQPFALQAGRFSARALIEGRMRSGILPSRALARIVHTPNIVSGVQQVDETVSQNPSVGVTYSPVSPPQFVPASQPDKVGAAIRAEVELFTPAGHRQFQAIESAVWIERLAEPFPLSAGGLDSIPAALLPKDAAAMGPIYGACFAIGGRHARSNLYTDPPPHQQDGLSADGGVQ